MSLEQQTNNQNYAFAVQLIESSRPNPSAEIFSTNISSTDMFLDIISSLDSKVPSENYQVLLHREGIRLEWEDKANKQGGRYSLFFASNIMAFRTFCILSVEWISKNLSFNDHITGLCVSIKDRSWNVQIWVDDGFDSRNISERYEYLINWLKNVVNIQNNDTYIIEFRIHPTYREYKTPLSKIKEQANQIASFQTCIKQLIGGGPSSKKIHPPPFDYKVAIFHKRSRRKRRELKSYVDRVYSS
ncbi:eukaryotic translation initiation factor 4E [Tritrichomonas musculus]|uniref:Eukaryotic translation initiation factor 4E n=1 Tax=Tritrichomonas musculus TaxID=1915356 RepID=A0ABR2HWR3_9EUKA